VKSILDSPDNVPVPSLQDGQDFRSGLVSIHRGCRTLSFPFARLDGVAG
jgi:hypothetical protein